MVLRSLYWLLLTALIVSCSTGNRITDVAEALIIDDQLQINKNSKFFELDPLGNIYFVDNADHIFLYCQDMKNYYEYSNKTFSNLTSIDVSNPQKILLFYSDFNTIIYLNNTLNEINRYNLVELGYNDITAAAKSNDNQTWIYDRYSYKLIKVNDNGKILLESNPLIDIGYGDLNPIKIIESNNIVYLLDSSKGILRFDNLGSFIDLVHLKDIDDLQVVKDDLLYLKDGHVYMMQAVFESKYELEGIDTPYLEKAKKIRVDNDYYYLLLSNGLYRNQR